MRPYRALINAVPDRNGGFVMGSRVSTPEILTAMAGGNA